ncbi:MAG: asparagine synthase (glutamine-hydrolyzing) [Vicinamibacterales bacterium]
MCGLAGLVSATGLDPEAPACAARMRDVLAHRGPDDFGLWSDDRAALAHRRLSIVDLAGGRQPLANETGSVQVAFNGEIYNHAELREALEARGHRYRTRSDTETLVHAYEEWGDGFVRRLRGMFAIALWDAPARRLLLVRDRLGIKPLYWARRRDTLLFGSEVKAILASGRVPAEAREGAIPEVLATRFVSGDATLFRGIEALEPGHQLVFERGVVRTSRYWDVPAGDRPEHLRDADVVPRFRALLDESVRLRLMSDVPLGVFLSGGIDSSAIAALMARHVSSPIRTFSVAFEDRAFNELEYARQVARAIGAESHEIVIDDEDFFGALPRLVWHEDTPIAHPSSVPLHFVSELARRHVTVVLTGEGSDELLAGYGKYPRTALNWRAGGIYEQAVPAAGRRALARVLPHLPGKLGRYAARSFLAMPRTPDAMLFDNFASVRLAEQDALLFPGSAAAAGRAAAYDACRHLYDAAPADSTFLDRLLYADIKTYLVELLMKQDRMSMSASIESRVPFLDHELVEFAARLPDRWKLSGWTTKRVLREAMKGVLPDSILHRPKLGFPVPFAGWVGGRWNQVARDVLLDRRCRQRGVLEPGAVARLLDDHAAGRVRGGDRIWSLLNLELWFRTFIDGDGVQTLPGPRPAASVAPAAATIDQRGVRA